VQIGFFCFRIGPVTGSCADGNEPSDSIKGGELFDKLSDYELLKKNFAPWSGLVIRIRT
jgi:hypothetical protein